MVTLRLIFLLRSRCLVRRQSRLRRARTVVSLRLFCEAMKRATAMYPAGFLFRSAGLDAPGGWKRKALVPLGDVLMAFHVSFTNLLTVFTAVERRPSRRDRFLFLLLLCGLNAAWFIRQFVLDAGLADDDKRFQGPSKPFSRHRPLPLDLVRNVRK